MHVKITYHARQHRLFYLINAVLLIFNIVADYANYRTMIDPRKSFYVTAFDPADDQDFAKCVETLVKDESQRQEMGKRCRELVEPRSWNVLCHNLVEKYYRSVL
jgi:glycosyltransferase involved in cell wall biosynthesis